MQKKIKKMQNIFKNSIDYHFYLCYNLIKEVVQVDNVLISACLLGVACRYDGQSRPYDLGKLKENFNLIPFCPEIYGGLPTPRFPGEIQGDRVFNIKGEDVTEQYQKGAEEALRLAKLFNVKFAVLKEKSPSCGKGRVYDGTFSKTLTNGDGVTACLLRNSGIEVFGEGELEKIFNNSNEKPL